MITIHLDVPQSFRPKAMFALETMFSAFSVSVMLADADTQSNPHHANIYYGLHPENQSKKADISIRLSQKTIAYFESKTTYDIENLFHIETDSGELPVLFGLGEQTDGVINADIVASAFFFLSDWQSVVPGPRDAHGRAMFKYSIQAHLNGGLRPIVNEYADFLVQLVKRETGMEIPLKTWNGKRFAGVITHDFDRIKKKYPGTWMREFVEIPFLNAHDLPPGARWRRFNLSLKDVMASDDGYERSIRKILEFEKENGIRPTVLLKSIIKKHKNDARDYLDYPFLEEILSLTEKAGGEIGFHSSYMAGFDQQLFEMEYEQIKKRIGVTPKSHRFHYVRFNLDYGLGIPEKVGFKTDSSLGWAEQSGYRTGFTHPHKIYDIRNNRVRSIVQLPMMLMDMQVFQYMHLDLEAGIQIAKKQVDTALRYGGIVVWNFHHHTYDIAETGDCHLLFEKSLNYLVSKEPEFLTMGEVYENS